MRHRHILVAALCIGLATPVFAAPQDNPHVAKIISLLQAEGYEKFEIERTWLGRIQIEAYKGQHEREIVINRGTGEVLRDYIEESDEYFFLNGVDD